MPRIAILSDTLASQVAAGEVVERPASVLKELIENSLDAGATHIEVESRKGGIALLKVTDNGQGMDKESALLSLERHATSKLSTSEGLSAITTHGFRGEALPSIASVTRFRLATNNDPRKSGTEVFIQGGKILSVDEAARAQGTTVEIKDLFFNVPARRKFLKSEATEYAHIEHTIRISALGNTLVRYTFKNNGKLLWDLGPTKDRRTRIADLSGKKVLDELKEVTPYSLGGITVEGYILPGRLSRGTSRSQTVFINGRPVDDPVSRSAIKDGYHGHIQVGQFPVVWLWVQMTPSDIDVNVHPAKKEVRFARPTEVKHAIIEAIGVTLSNKPRPVISAPDFSQNSDDVTEVSLKTNDSSLHRKSGKSYSDKSPSLRLTREWATPDQQEITLEPTTRGREQTPPLNPQPSNFKIIGTFKEKYILLEDDTGLVVFNPKAAKARITYEQLKKCYTGNTLDSQPLLIPLLLELDGHEQVAMKNYLYILNELGIEIASFGGNTFQVQSLPSLLEITETGDVENFILGILDTLESTSYANIEKAIERLLVSMSSESSKHRPQHCDHTEKLLQELMKCDLPYCTPAGKPTMIHYSENEIKKKMI